MNEKLDKRFGKARCISVVRVRGESRQCGLPQYKDGLCKKHHPEGIAENEKRMARNNPAWTTEIQAKEKAIAIERAIVLLVQNGYRVEKVPQNAE